MGEIVERVLAVVHGEDRQAYTPYNVVTNNCEHFATWARNGWSISGQVARKSEQVLKLVPYLVAGFAILPRPVSILGGLCAAGLQVLNEVRRDPGTNTDNDSVVPGSEMLQITDMVDSGQVTTDVAEFQTIRRREL